MNITNIINTVSMLQGWFSKVMKLSQVVGENSYSDLTKETKVEPWVIVSKDCVGIEAMPDIMQGVLNYVIADYGQAVNIFGKIDDIKVRRALGTFNPNRDGTAGALLASINLESYSAKAMQFSLPIGSIPTVEAKGPEGSGKELQEEARNMSVGKLIDIPFSIGGVDKDGKQATVTLPIQFRLLVNYISSPSMLNILSNGQDDTGFWARFERARDGGIAPAMDFLLAQDMIEEKRKVLFSEDGKLLTKILARKDANKRAAIASRSPSLATLSNVFIVTESEAKDLESRLGRGLASENAREQLFRNVSASTLIVIDRNWNNVTFYQRGFSQPSTLDFSQLKTQAGGKGPDLMDMFRQFNMGMPIA